MTASEILPETVQTETTPARGGKRGELFLAGLCLLVLVALALWAGIGLRRQLDANSASDSARARASTAAAQRVGAELLAKYDAVPLAGAQSLTTYGGKTDAGLYRVHGHIRQCTTYVADPTASVTLICSLSESVEPATRS